MSDCSREAWNAPRGIDGAVHWQDGTESELHYARFVNGEERKVECIELDGMRYLPEIKKLYGVETSTDLDDIGVSVILSTLYRTREEAEERAEKYRNRDDDEIEYYAYVVEFETVDE